MARKPPARRSEPKGSKGFRTTPAKRRPPRAGALPTRDEILAFIREQPQKVGKREIARAFDVRGPDRIGLKRLLADMAGDGALSGNRKAMRETGRLPPVAVLEVTGRDADGDLLARPAVWSAADGDRPTVLLLTHLRRAAEELAVGVGDRVLARINRLEAPDIEGHRYEAEPIKVLPREKRRALGIFRAKAKGGGGTIEPIDRKELRSWSIAPGNEGGARDGDLVHFELAASGRRSLPEARIVEALGNPDDERRVSLIAIHAHGLPHDFPAPVLAESENLAEPTLDGRTDLRATPLVTIDPADARDHDDAVYAEPDTDPRNAGGHVVIVAIADVAHYVRPGTRLDREALLRGNSVYFPDRVVPMLPERISNDLCSLREAEDRPCLAVRMVFDRSGAKRGHTFLRAMMRSAAKLSYREAQAAIDGAPSARAAPLMDRVLKPLWAAYAALGEARDARGPLDLDLPERKIVLDDSGRIAEVVIPERLAAHRLIEEFMIQANVAAAETLEQRRAPVVYRVHDEPSKEKLQALRDFLETLDIKIARDATLKPKAFNKILAQAKSLPVPDLVSEVVLRSQAQAEYNTANVGHFGLNLARYAHFTSPIRRYADLVVHRALVHALRLGAGGLDPAEIPRLPEIARQISQAERRAMAAERETVDRLVAMHLADRVGATFAARVAGVTRSGLFVRLNDTRADGFVPASTLTRDYYRHVEEAHALVGARTGETYQLGDAVSVRLVEVIPAAGAMRFEMLTPGKTGRALGPVKGGRGVRSRRRY